MPTTEVSMGKLWGGGASSPIQPACILPQLHHLKNASETLNACCAKKLSSHPARFQSHDTAASHTSSLPFLQQKQSACFLPQASVGTLPLLLLKPTPASNSNLKLTTCSKTVPPNQIAAVLLCTSYPTFNSRTILNSLLSSFELVSISHVHGL